MCAPRCRSHDVTAAGILLEQKGKATLTDYNISDNFAEVLDRIKGQRGRISE